MARGTSQKSRPVRTVVAVAAGVFLAWLGGLILGEYPFNGFLPILGGAGLGMAIAWVVTRAFGGDPPPWMAFVAAALAVYGEFRAVDEDTAPGVDYPVEGWIAMALAGLVAGYNVFTAAQRSRQST